LFFLWQFSPFPRFVSARSKTSGNFLSPPLLFALFAIRKSGLPPRIPDFDLSFPFSLRLITPNLALELFPQKVIQRGTFLLFSQIFIPQKDRGLGFFLFLLPPPNA